MSFSLIVKSQEKDIIEWKTVQQADSLQLKGDKRLILMDVYAEWCGPCKLMDKHTFQNKEVAQYINENFIPVKFNAESKEDVTFKGKTYQWVSNGRTGLQAFAYFILGGQVRYPSMPIIDTNGRPITSITGYYQAEEFLSTIKDVKGKVDEFLANEQQ